MGELNEGTIKEQESNILDYPKSNLIHTCNKRQRNPVEACAWYFDKEYHSLKVKDLIMDYFVHGGYVDLIELLCEEAGDPFPDLEQENIAYRESIRKAIIRGDINEAMVLLDLHGRSGICDRNLDLKLCNQHLVELIRCGKTNEALKFSEEFLVKKVKGNSKGREQVEQTFSLLAFQDPSQSPYAKVLDASHRELLAYEVNAALRGTLPYADNLIRMLCWLESVCTPQKNYTFTTQEGLSEFIESILYVNGIYARSK
ncbi:unnamed protein product [Dracunculus medinensis]|uniref:LisH domain-containing protein n=1 Tax=Dracunculus medinensis TaxID=318479 RepID=A0A0N4UQD9_DRAME|nr:unnamed protein product [Dracunculus medinensis]